MKNFTCKVCGSTEVEEVMENVTQISTVSAIEEDGCLDYDNYCTEGGEVDRYQCAKCGKFICGTAEELSEMFERQDR